MQHPRAVALGIPEWDWAGGIPTQVSLSWIGSPGHSGARQAGMVRAASCWECQAESHVGWDALCVACQVSVQVMHGAGFAPRRLSKALGGG